MNTKICSICKQCLPIEMFPESSRNNYKNTNLKNLPTHEGRCRPCKAEYARQWRKQNPGYVGTGKLTSIPDEDRLLVSAISERLVQANTRAKDKGLLCDLSREYLYQLFKDQKGLCALSGVTLKIEKGSVTCLSLDKIEPNKGYCQGNVQWVAWAVNRAKGDLSTEIFLDMCKKILDYQKVQRLS